jgi:hypothetical protein
MLRPSEESFISLAYPGKRCRPVRNYLSHSLQSVETTDRSFPPQKHTSISLSIAKIGQVPLFEPPSNFCDQPNFFSSTTANLSINCSFCRPSPLSIPPRHPFTRLHNPLQWPPELSKMPHRPQRTLPRRATLSRRS